MRSLSKSKLLAYHQCPKRLWLEIHHADLIEWSDQAQASFLVGHEVGEIARKLYDPKGKGVVFDPGVEGYDEVVTLPGSPASGDQRCPQRSNQAGIA